MMFLTSFPIGIDASPGDIVLMGGKRYRIVRVCDSCTVEMRRTLWLRLLDVFSLARRLLHRARGCGE
jgi:hypothetical protein